MQKPHKQSSDDSYKAKIKILDKILNKRFGVSIRDFKDMSKIINKTVNENETGNNMAEEIKKIFKLTDI